ncbi:MAG: transrane protein [Betaproteobacteria bacterium]|nr:transrane protein [Betaproteobacteria bacterium]
MIWEIGSVLKHTLLPPLALGWVLLLVWLLMRRRPRTARWLLGLVLLFGYLAATPWLSNTLMDRFVIDRRPPAATAPQAIVVLGGGRGLAFDAQGRVAEAFPIGGTMDRLFTGARLQRQTKLPVLVTGGKNDGYDPAEGEMMRDVLLRDFNVPVRWVEVASRNTVENASMSAPLLRAAGVKTIFLVTNDFHVRRARALFEAQGFAVVPVPALVPLAPDGRPVVEAPSPFSWRELVPNTAALGRTFLACNEIAGMLYARMNMP